MPNSSPEGFLGDELGKNPISLSTWPKLDLNGLFWHSIKLRYLIFMLGIIYAPNSSPKGFLGNELGKNPISWSIWPKLALQS